MSTHRHVWLIPPLALFLGACTPHREPVERVTHEERALAKAHSSWAALFAERADETFSPGNIQRFSPYSATLENGTWTVRGTVPADFHGKVPEARIRAGDGVTTVQVLER
jgi:hypothetical protein